MTARIDLILHAPIVEAMFGATRGRSLLLVGAGVALLTLSAKIQIPAWPVPTTMQTYVVLVIAMGYGLRLGLCTVVAYLMLGAMGLPVFAGTPQQGIGLMYMTGPTGGYLVGFAIAAALCGRMAERGWDRHLGSCLVAMTLGHLVILGCGFAWLSTIIGWQRAVDGGLTPFILATLVKTALAAASIPAAWRLRQLSWLANKPSSKS
jgi:biotin transport system substrate-specific component